MRAELLDIASEAIMVRDMNDAIQFWNTGAENLYGWRREEVIGKDIHTLLQTFSRFRARRLSRALVNKGPGKAI